MAIAREGYPFIIVALLFAVMLFVISLGLSGYLVFIARLIAVTALFLALFMAYFFRDPERTVPCNDTALIAPADGTVIDIRETEEPLYLKSTALRISIFMSVFDVHVNRSPVTGTIGFIHYHPGKFISAFKEKASLDNESVFVGIRSNDSQRKIAVKFIAGLIARRIVFKKNEQEVVRQGERVGMIRFGSRAELFCPKGTELKVKKGDKVKAGETIVSILKR